MSDFFKKLEKYINKMEKKYPIELAPHFKYDETTIISSDIANQLYALYEKLITIQELWEKEKDYSRLLKKENDELGAELNQLYLEQVDYDNENEDDVDIENKLLF